MIKAVFCFLMIALKFNFDFRGLYSDILEDWLSVESKEIVGGNFEKIKPFIR